MFTEMFTELLLQTSYKHLVFPNMSASTCVEIITDFRINQANIFFVYVGKMCTMLDIYEMHLEGFAVL